VLFFPKNNLNWTQNWYGIFKIDVDLGGQDMNGPIQSTSFENCLASCVSTTSCTHVTYWYTSDAPYTQGTCWLKYGPRSQYDATPLLNCKSAILNQSYNFKLLIYSIKPIII
jgi:hypothetical protein